MEEQELKEAYDHIDGLEDQCAVLEEKMEELEEEIKLCQDPTALVNAVKEYLEWSDEPNPTMNRDAQADITRQLRWALNDALKEMEG